MIKGYKNRDKAYQASKRVNTNPSVVAYRLDVTGESYFGRGETLLRNDGTRDYYVYGQRGKSVLASDLYRACSEVYSSIATVKEGRKVR